MLREKLALIVGICTRHAWAVIAVAVLSGIVAGVYGARHFAIDTDIGKLISPDLPWRKRELAFMAAFPQRIDTIFVVVDAPTPELAGQAAALLTQKLQEQKSVFQTVEEPGNSPLFTRNGLLFLPTEELEKSTAALAEAKPVIQVLHSDPSLRGLVQALAFIMAGIQVNRITLDDMARALNLVDTSLENVLAGRTASFSWRELTNGKPLEPMDLRRFIQIRPILDYQALEPGQQGDRRDPQDRGRSGSRPEIPGAGAADRSGRDPGRGIRHVARRRVAECDSGPLSPSCSSCGSR